MTQEISLYFYCSQSNIFHIGSPDIPASSTLPGFHRQSLYLSPILISTALGKYNRLLLYLQKIHNTFSVDMESADVAAVSSL